MYYFVAGQCVTEADDVQTVHPNAVFLVDGEKQPVPLFVINDVDPQNLRREAHQIIDNLFDSYVTMESD